MIDFKNISKSYGGQVIFDCFDLRVGSGERVGVVGPNGAGKSTLFEIITGATLPDQGEVMRPRNHRIGYLKQQLPQHEQQRLLAEFTADAIPELREITAQLHELEHQMAESADVTEMLKKHGRLQSRFEHLGGYNLKSEAESALSGLGFDPARLERPLAEFSGGWQMRAALARVLISKPDILLLDEPSNYLDIPAVEWLSRFLKSFRGTLLLISHDRYLLNRLTGITLEVNAGQVTRYAGNYDFYRRERETRRVSLEAAHRNQQRKREQLERNIERFKAKNSKAAQAQSWRKQLEKMAEITLPDELNFSGSIRIPDAPPCGVEAARLENVSFSYDKNKTILDGLDLQIGSGEKIGFVGYNGTGKTTLLKMIAGALKPDKGRVVLGHNIIPGYQAQEFAEILPDENSALDVVRAAAGAKTQGFAAQSVLGSFGFGGDNAHKPCKVLSGGEKIRLCFARIFVNPPNFLILDEPTTHLDIAAREALQQALNDYKGAVCLVSHDIEFVRKTVDFIIAMRPPGVKKYYGNYDYYLEKFAAENTNKTAPDQDDALNSKDSGRERRRERAEKRNALSADKKKIEKTVARLEAQLETLEERREELVKELSGDGVDFERVNRDLHNLIQKIDDVMLKWEAAAEQLEEIRQLNEQIHK